MNIFKKSTKEVTIISKEIEVTDSTKKIEALKTWSVRWDSYDSVYMGSRSYPHLVEQAEFFTDYDKAVEFKENLDFAQKFLKNNGSLNIKLAENV
jgi:hypothetical protein